MNKSAMVTIHPGAPLGLGGGKANERLGRCLAAADSPVSGFAGLAIGHLQLNISLTFFKLTTLSWFEESGEQFLHDPWVLSLKDAAHRRHNHCHDALFILLFSLQFIG